MQARSMRDTPICSMPPGTAISHEQLLLMWDVLVVWL
jgi:hypothetical protein